MNLSTPFDWRPQKPLAIEYGDVFYRKKPKQRVRGAEKERLLKEKGWTLVRVVDGGLPLEEVKEKARGLFASKFLGQSR